MLTKVIIILVPLMLLTNCESNKEDLNALKKEQEQTNRRLREIQRNDALEREGQAQRNMESYLR